MDLETGSHDEPGVDHDQLPLTLAAGHDPRLLLGHRLGQAVGIVQPGAGAIPHLLGPNAVRDIVEVARVVVDGDTRRRKDDTLHRRRLVGRRQHILRPLHCRFEQILVRILHTHGKGRGGVEDDSTSLGGLIEAPLLEQIASKEPNRSLGFIGLVLQVLDAILLRRIASGGMDRQAAVEQVRDEDSSHISRGACDHHRGLGIDLKFFRARHGLDLGVEWCSV
mmetsp:Transcript_11531/g.32666  ORF Transcript_11531/g.32666 Transcript_11531/m.32666 type:complete len:222 (+) Transcript_11531:523-1188(+)